MLGTGPSYEKKQRNIEAGSNSVNKKQKEIKVNIKARNIWLLFSFPPS